MPPVSSDYFRVLLCARKPSISLTAVSLLVKHDYSVIELYNVMFRKVVVSYITSYSVLLLKWLVLMLYHHLTITNIINIVDSHLTYDSHITKLVSSCMAKLCQINRVKGSFDKDTLTLIISALVISKLVYCSTVWSNTSSTNLKKLQAVQNFACRIITNTKKFDRITPALRQLNWLPVKQQLFYREAVMTYKCINNLIWATNFTSARRYTTVLHAIANFYKSLCSKLRQGK